MPPAPVMGDLRSLHLAPWIELHEAVRQKSRPRGIRVAGAAPTNEQVFSLVRSIADSEPGQAVAYVPAKDVELSVWARRPNFFIFAPAHHASGRGVVIGTIDKLASARNPRNLNITRPL